jgi:hypothetical protein
MTPMMSLFLRGLLAIALVLVGIAAWALSPFFS